jgi:hypothetical protein
MDPPLDRNFRFTKFFLRFGSKPYHCAKFQLPRPSGNAREFFPMLNLWGLGGPWFRPWTAILGFKIFPYSFRATVISIMIFTLLRYRGVLYNIIYFARRQGPLAPPLYVNFRFTKLFLWFGVKFQLSRPSGSAWEFFPMLNLWGLKGPLVPLFVSGSPGSAH